jgi:Hypervirulence associated proteins TUDOR domain
MANSFGTGKAVKWNWGSGTGQGKVKEKFERRVQRTIKGAKVVKNGTSENPAYLIEQEDGGKVLKRGSELSPA